ncbi:Leucine-rich repeat receptor-like protein kinase PXC2 [Camellia lanceoleosa]|nr:Leucine-rich repeat receptor-like protein kinase PXC2 [Camellia lanceoleosa]
MLSLSSHLHLHLILLSFVTLQCLIVTTATCHVDDEAGLLAFKSIIFSTLTELRSLSLSHNKFSRKIPSTISALAPKLIYLELGHNYFTGQIPDFLGSFHALDTLDLSWNRFSGTVPKSFGNLTKIFNLDLSHNFLVDPFPEMNVKGIESLDLSYNGFHLSEIPKWSLHLL